MRHYWSLDRVHLENSWVTIGTFDGVHRGHQAIVNRVVSGARSSGSTSVVITFHPHPAVVLGKRQDANYLTTPEERAELLGYLGVDVVITHPFNREVASLSAYEFISEMDAHLNISRLFVGNDFALGKGREGNVERLRVLGEEFGYQLEVVPPIKNGDVVVSSSTIRAKISEGNVAQAARLIGRLYKIKGEVIPGDGRGKLLGIPTANLSIWAERTIPKAGVYACKAISGGNIHQAVTNIGFRPTFENEPVAPRVETHLLDYDGNLYGKELSLEFVDRLRDEKKFPDIQALIDQIHIDISRAREILGP
jgi:riboflavin kinase / FMN adenylyltransferase